MSLNASSSVVDSTTVSAATEAVRRASRLTADAQRRIGAGDTLVKDDHSPVTIADFAAQAVVCSSLVSALGPIEMVGEEDANDLLPPAANVLLEGVRSLIAASTEASVSAADVLEWISVGSGSATGDRYWTLDPIDGTKGFLRGDQYAIALGLIVEGEVVLGVLGCPNMLNDDGSVGALFVAANGAVTVESGVDPVPSSVVVGSPASVSDARLCESVESGHSDQAQSVSIAKLLGIEAEPFRIDSQCKYGAVARGDASIYLRLPTRADYVEKIWDHAAGKLVVEAAGGVVTDVNGRPLDFSKGARLSENRGVVASSGQFHDEIIAAVQRVLS